MSYDKDYESENNLSDYESDDQTLENSEEKEYFQKELESESDDEKYEEDNGEDNESTLESSSSIKESFQSVTNKLNKFLNEYRILPNNPNNLPSTDANVLRVSYPPGKYYISYENYDTFIDYYIDILTHEEFNYQKYQLNFGERDCNTKPLLLDFDFNYTANIENRIYDNVIIDIINIVDSVIVTNFDIEHPISYLFEKNKPTRKDETTFKDGVHIVYSYPFSPNQRDYIYVQVLEKLKENKTFDKLDVINSYNDIFDYTTINTNCWMMYGSTKILKKNDKIEICPKYQLTKAFKDGNATTLESIERERLNYTNEYGENIQKAEEEYSHYIDLINRGKIRADSAFIKGRQEELSIERHGMYSDEDYNRIYLNPLAESLS